MALAWQAIFGIDLFIIGGVIPFAIFLYESNEVGRTMQSRVWEALTYQGVAIAVSAMIIALTWVYLSTFNFPVSAFVGYEPLTSTKVTSFGQCSQSDLAYKNDPTIELSCRSFNVTTNETTGEYFVVPDLLDPNGTLLFSKSSWTPSTTYQSTSNTLLCPNTFWVFLACLLSFVGWFMFAIFTGVGLISLPIDLIKAFKNRPRYIPKDVYLKLRDDLQKRVNELMTTGCVVFFLHLYYISP